MTQDFLYDFVEACEKEGWSYIVVMAPPGEKEVNISFNLDKWQGHPEKTKSQDLLDLLKSVSLVDEADIRS